MQAKQEVLITSIHLCYYGTKRSILKVTLCGKKGNALLKSAPFCLIIECRKLRVSISKILLNWQKNGVYACVQCANSTQLPLQKFLKVIVCFNKVFKNPNIYFLRILFSR